MASPTMKAPTKGGLNFYEIIIKLGLEKIFNNLKNEAVKNEMKNYKLVKNVCCPVCETTENNYTKLYTCSHHCCYNCFNEWKLYKNNYPICRAENYSDPFFYDIDPIY